MVNGAFNYLLELTAVPLFQRSSLKKAANDHFLYLKSPPKHDKVNLTFEAFN